MDADYAGREEACCNCVAPEPTKDDEGYCFPCPMKALVERYPPDFRIYVDNLIRLKNWFDAGYLIDPDELSASDWDAYSLIVRYQKVKDLENQARMTQVMV